MPPAQAIAAPRTLREIWFGTTRYWVCQLVGWGGVAAVGAIITFLLSQREVVAVVDRTLAQSSQTSRTIEGQGDAMFMALTCAAGLLASHGWRAVILGQRWLQWPHGRLAVHSLLWLTALSLLLAVLGVRVFTQNVPEENAVANVIACTMMNATLLGAWCAIYLLVHFYDGFHRANLERAQLQAAGTASQLITLQQQLNPHFLFNSLNTIRALIPVAATEARSAVTFLAETLRATLLDGKAPTISLARELEIVRSYLRLERLRFEDDLTVEEDIAPAALTVAVPSLMLQTLVENAIKHGLLQTGGRGALRLAAHIDAGVLCVRVTSPVVSEASTPAVESASLGIGLENVRARLELIFGSEASLLLHAPRAGVIEAVVRIPTRTPDEKRAVA